MSIARLLDPPVSFGKDNLSLSRILRTIRSADDQAQIQREYDDVVPLYDSALKHWRNRKLSHNDLMTITGIAPLPKMSFAEISELIGKINQLGRRIGHVVQGVHKSFVPAISNDSWVWRLIETLKKGTSRVKGVDD